ncbi:MAG: hypothetical protein VX780_04115 [Pseudomonadota bacterium]|nr:hypothetical protein [Pseudomonadota bacterium]
MPSVNPIRIATLADFKANEYWLNIYCHLLHQLNLEEFFEARRCDLNYVYAKFRCKRCRGAAQKN